MQKNNNIKLFVATPVHSHVSIHYTQSIFGLQRLCNEKKIPIMLHMMQSSLVTQGRNLCVADFLNSECTHMLFIDSDILFKAESIIKMIEKNQEVLSIPYPMKNILWHKVLDKWRGIPSMNFEQASTCGNVFPIKIKNGTEDIDVIDDMVELTHSMTGCMLIKRQVFDKMIKEYPDLTIHQDSIIDDKLVRKKNLYNFFDTYYDKENKLYLGEDFAFSRLWTKIGGKCMALITEYITHVGEYPFKGRLMDEMVPVGLDRQEKKS